MKKRILMLLCTAVLALSITAPPALAAGGPFYPISVEEYTYGSFDELRINKVYQLSLSDDPSRIPTEDFERNGRRYFLLDMIQEDEVGVDTQDYTDTITQDSDTNDLSAVLKQLDPHREVTTEDGYTGLLALDYTSVTVEAKGYKTSTKSLSATRTYPNLSEFIFSLIRAIGLILLGFGILQLGLSLKSHDPSRRANGMLTIAGGIVITFTKEILTLITGG